MKNLRGFEGRPIVTIFKMGFHGNILNKGVEFFLYKGIKTIEGPHHFCF
jgi:hypothetical protein